MREVVGGVPSLMSSIGNVGAVHIYARYALHIPYIGLGTLAPWRQSTAHV